MPPKKPMTKAQIVANLAEKTGLAKKDVKAVLETMTDMAYKEARIGFRSTELPDRIFSTVKWSGR